jgi:hypothetical protein
MSVHVGRPDEVAHGRNDAMARKGRGSGLGDVHFSSFRGRAKREPRCAIAHQRIHNHDREYGYRACAKWRIPDVQLHIGE